MSYTKQIFTSGQILKASDLNTMSQGIVDKQDKLVSGTNIKTVNGQSLLGSGDITIEGGSGAETEIPAYWQDHMDSKVAEINAYSRKHGGLLDAFVFITDMHAPTYSNGNELPLINYVLDNTSLRKVYFGGDILQGVNKSADLLWLHNFRSGLTKKAQLYPMRGNHDNWANITAQEYWDVLMRGIEYAECSEQMYYYRDDTVQKIRYIFTDSTYSAEGPVYDTTDDVQIAWMQDRILELDETWTVLVLHHGIWTASKSSTVAVNADGQVMIDAIDAIYDQSLATIAGILVGHCHRDNAVQQPKGYWLISVSCDANGAQAAFDVKNPSRAKGTVTEHVFDVVTIVPSTQTIKTFRVGAGSNREFVYKKAEIVNVPVTGVTLSSTSIDVGLDSTAIVTANIAPTNASNKNVTWALESGNEYVSITPSGNKCVISGKAEGQAVITVVTEDGAFNASCTATVKRIAVTGVTLDKATATTAIGKTVTLNASVTPSGASNTGVTWSIESGADYITIAPNGLSCTVSGVAVGDAVVKVTTDDGSHTASAIITVTELSMDDLTNSVTWERGPIQAVNGSALNDANWVHSNYVDVSGYTTLEMTVANTMTASGSLGYSFYNSSNVCIGGETHNYGSSAYGYEVMTIAVPSGAKYLRTTWYSSTNSNYNPDWKFSLKAK